MCMWLNLANRASASLPLQYCPTTCQNNPPETRTERLERYLMLEPNLVAVVPRSLNILRQENVGKKSSRRNVLTSSQWILKLWEMDKRI